jgi:excisionase family DNA binding protein
MPPTESGGEILTIKELCDLLHLPRSTVYKMARQGKIPGFRVAKHWRFNRGRIMRWMAEQTKSPA